VYQETASYPENERYGLITQIRRSAISIASNIAEGTGRNSPKEFVQYLSISIGSCFELETQLIIARNLNFSKDDNEIVTELNEIQKMIHSFMKKLKLKTKHV
jgi:four helix bundle protein